MRAAMALRSIDKAPAGAPSLPTVTAPLHLRYDAQTQTAANGASLSSLVDQSGNARDATKNAGTISYNTGGINSHPTFDFASGSYATTAAFTAIAAGTAITIFAVAQFATTGDRALFSSASFTMQAGCVSAGSAWRMDRGGAQATGGTADTNPHRFRYFFAASGGATSTMALDGTTVVGPASCGSAAPTTIRLGANSSGFENFSGKIGEILVYRGALTSPETAAVEAYLSAKWGI